MTLRRTLRAGLRLFLAIVISTIAIGSSGAISATAQADQLEDEFVRRLAFHTNDLRAQMGLPPLKIQSNLADAAAWYARDMAENDYVDFGHNDMLGRTPIERIPAFGYMNWTSGGENIASGWSTPEAVIVAWMNSPSHREQIASANFCEMGVGYAFNADSAERHYWVQVFGCRRDVYPTIINDDDPVAWDHQVHLYTYGDGWAEEMRVSNDGETWTEWEPFQPVLAWTLEPGWGERSVFVELRQGETVVQASDTIELVPPEN